VPAEKRARFATAYELDLGTREAKPLTQFFASLRPPEAPPAFPKGGYGLVSTIDDYLQFARMLLGQGAKDGVRILSRRTASLMTSNYLTAEQRAAIPAPVDGLFKGQGWGLGLAVVVDPPRQDELNGFGSLGTFGWPGALGTWWQADPKEDMIQIYMNQFLTFSPRDLPRFLFQNLGYQAIED
jgi:CubicO group peptidase (beta-lactamase class C family)